MHRAFLLLLPALILGCGTDTKPSGPRVSSTVPSDGATGVPLLPDIAVTFSADMDVETVSASLSGSACTGAIQLSADDFVTCVPFEDVPASDDGRTFVVRPDAPLEALALHSLRVTRDARSEKGFQLDREFEMDSGFTTADAPAVASTMPADGATGVAVAATALSVTFTRTMDADTVTAQTASEACAGSLQVSRDGFATCVRMAAQPQSADGLTFTVEPVAPLASADLYRFRVAADTADTAGNTIGQTWQSPEGFLTRYVHGVVIDGVNDFDTGNERVDTSSSGAGYYGYLAWDDANLYVGMEGADVGSGSATRFVLVYLGGAGGTTAGQTYNTQSPVLPFDAAWHVRWKADNTFTEAQEWNGASWVTASWNATAFQSGTFVELSIPLAPLGLPATLPVHVSMINEENLVEATYAVVPATSILADGYDPDYGEYYLLDLLGSTVPSAHTPQ